MKLFRTLALLIVMLSLATACDNKDTGEVIETPTTEVPSDEEVIDETEVDDDVEVPAEIDWDIITSTVHTIPRESPYETGLRVISSMDNALVNGDFQAGQMPWQINTVDGIVFDQGLLIQSQTAVLFQSRIDEYIYISHSGIYINCTADNSQRTFYRQRQDDVGLGRQ